MADDKKKYQKNVKTRKSMINYDVKTPEQIAALAAMTVPIAVYGAIDQFDKFKERRKQEKLNKVSKIKKLNEKD